MLFEDDAIVRPLKGGFPKDLAPVCVMVATRADTMQIAGASGYRGGCSRGLLLGKLYFPDRQGRPGYCLAGPAVGAPYAVMLLETLLAWGVRRIIFVGWCGALRDGVAVGDIIVPTGAFIDEGTSLHYEGEPGSLSTPSDTITGEIRAAFERDGIACLDGPVWSTDAIFRETPEKVVRFREMGALAVEMELSALFTVARYRGVRLGAVLVVSDLLSDMTWRPGFKDEQFSRRRQAVCKVVTQLCQTMSLSQMPEGSKS